MKLKVGKDSKWLDLFPNTSIQMDINSPVYFGSRLPGFLPSVKTYSFNVPPTARNRQLLDRPELLDNPGDLLEEEGWQIIFSGLVISIGRLEVEDAPKSGPYKITIIGGIGGNLYGLKKLYISQLQLGTVPLGENTEDVLVAASEVTQNAEDYNYLFPTIRVAQDPAYVTESVEEGEPAPDPEPTLYKYLNRYINGSHVREEEQFGDVVYSSLSPMLRLRYVIEKALESVNYNLRGVFDSDEHAAELSNLVLFNTATLDVLDSIPLNGEIKFSNLELRTQIDLRQHIPPVKANDLIREVCNTFCWAPFIDPINKTIRLKPLRDILKGGYQDWTGKVSPNYKKDRKVENIPLRFAYEHITDDEYAKKSATRYQPRSVYKEYPDFQSARDDLTSDDIGQIVYIESLNEHYEMRGFRPPSTVPVLQSYGKSLGEINENSEPAFIPNTDSLLMITRSDNFQGVQGYTFSGDEFLPAYYGGLVTPWYEEGKQVDKIILLFYRGLHQDGTGQQYPLAASNSYNWDEERIAELSLLWRGEDGIYNTWWKDWHQAISRMRPVVYATRLDVQDIARLDFSKKIRIDKHLYFLKRVQVTINANSINTAKVEYMQIN